MGKISKKKSEEVSEKEEWMPSKEEQMAFKKFIEPFIEWKEESEFEWNGKMTKIKAHFGYKGSNPLDAKNRVMNVFGAVSLTEHAGRTQIAIRLHEWSNTFIKSGQGLSLYHKFEILEKIYFRSKFGEQKSMEFYEENLSGSEIN